jgi:hypothetical protein
MLRQTAAEGIISSGVCKKSEVANDCVELTIS